MKFFNEHFTLKIKKIQKGQYKHCREVVRSWRPQTAKSATMQTQCAGKHPDSFIHIASSEFCQGLNGSPFAQQVALASLTQFLTSFWTVIRDYKHFLMLDSSPKASSSFSVKPPKLHIPCVLCLLSVSRAQHLPPNRSQTNSRHFSSTEIISSYLLLFWAFIVFEINFIYFRNTEVEKNINYFTSL